MKLPLPDGYTVQGRALVVHTEREGVPGVEVIAILHPPKGDELFEKFLRDVMELAYARGYRTGKL